MNKDENKTRTRQIILFGIPVLGFLIIFSLFFEIYTPVVVDKWTQGVVLVDSSTRVKDSAARIALLEKGGAILRQQIQLHPYHARVWFMFGYYFLVKDQWDSCIYAEKKAIELGAGGTVNQVEFYAAEYLNHALGKKVDGMNNPDSALKAINDAVTPNFDNPVLNRIRGFAFYRFNQPDSSIYYLERYNAKVANDADVLMILAFDYYKKGMLDKALLYGTEARKINNNNTYLNNLVNQLSTGK